MGKWFVQTNFSLYLVSCSMMDPTTNSKNSCPIRKRFTYYCYIICCQNPLNGYIYKNRISILQFCNVCSLSFTIKGKLITWEAGNTINRTLIVLCRQSWCTSFQGDSSEHSYSKKIYLSGAAGDECLSNICMLRKIIVHHIFRKQLRLF